MVVKLQAKALACVLSILLHGMLLFFFLFLESSVKEGALWSGGYGAGRVTVTTIDLQGFSPSSMQKSGVTRLLKPKFSSETQASSGQGASDTPGGGVGDGLDENGAQRATVLSAIRKRILQQKVFPHVAMDNGWSGSVTLQFKLTPEGGLEYVKVLKSSGYTILDENAMRTVRRATPLPYYSRPIALALDYQLK